MRLQLRRSWFVAYCWAIDDRRLSCDHAKITPKIPNVEDGSVARPDMRKELCPPLCHPVSVVTPYQPLRSLSIPRTQTEMTRPQGPTWHSSAGNFLYRDIFVTTNSNITYYKVLRPTCCGCGQINAYPNSDAATLPFFTLRKSVLCHLLPKN